MENALDLILYVTTKVENIERDLLVRIMVSFL